MTDTANAAFTTPAARRSDPRLLAGVGFVVIFLLGLATSFALATTSWPTPATPPAEVLAFFTDSRSAVVLNALAQAVAAVPLLVFSAGLARTFGGRAAPQLTAAGALAAGTLLSSAAVINTVSWPTLAGEPSIAATLYYLGYLLGGPAHVVALAVLVGTTAVAGLLSGRLPRWVSVLGFVAAGLGLLAVLNFLVPAVPSAVVGPFIPAGRFLGFVFIVAAVVALRRARGVTTR